MYCNLLLSALNVSRCDLSTMMMTMMILRFLYDKDNTALLTYKIAGLRDIAPRWLGPLLVLVADAGSASAALRWYCMYCDTIYHYQLSKFNCWCSKTFMTAWRLCLYRDIVIHSPTTQNIFFQQSFLALFFTVLCFPAVVTLYGPWKRYEIQLRVHEIRLWIKL